MKLLLLLAMMSLPPQQPTIVRQLFPPKTARDTTANLIVIHYDSGNSSSAIIRYLRRTNKSYHYYIERNGRIINLVNPKQMAGHAGVSRWGTLSSLNFSSIGICLQNIPPQRYTDAQYVSLVFLVRQLQKRWPDITMDRIVGHEDVAYPRGRKRDPGKMFDWVLFRTAMDTTQFKPAKKVTKPTKRLAKPPKGR